MIGGEVMEWLRKEEIRWGAAWVFVAHSGG